ASVGLTEEAATDAGYDVVTGEMRHAATIAITAQVPVSTLQHAVPVVPTASEVWVRLLDQVTEKWPIGAAQPRTCCRIFVLLARVSAVATRASMVLVMNAASESAISAVQ